MRFVAKKPHAPRLTAVLSVKRRRRNLYVTVGEFGRVSHNYRVRIKLGRYVILAREYRNGILAVLDVNLKSSVLDCYVRLYGSGVKLRFERINKSEESFLFYFLAGEKAYLSESL